MDFEIQSMFQSRNFTFIEPRVEEVGVGFNRYTV